MWMQPPQRPCWAKPSDRKQQLGHQCSGSDSGLHDAPRLHHVVRPVFHHARCGCSRHNGRAGRNRPIGNNNWATNAQGVTPDYMTLRDYTMLSGQFFTTQDVDAAAKTAVLGETVATNLFGDSDPTGQVVIIKNVPFTVAGVLTPKGQSARGQDPHHSS